MSTLTVVWWVAATLLPLAGLWLLWRLALRPEACFGYNRALLLLAPVLAAAWPLLPRPAAFGPERFLLEAPGTPGQVSVTLVRLPVLYVSAAGHALGWQGWQLLAAIYAAGVLLGLGWLAARYWRLHRAVRGLPRQARPGYQLACTGGRLPTSSWGRLVLWDETASLSAAEAQAVLAHELAHVRQHHSHDVLWLQLWRVLLWPNPFAHLLLPALRLTHELLADRAALAAAPVAPAVYPALLARLATRHLLPASQLALLQSFTFSFTLTRIAMLQRPHPVRRWKQWLVLPALGSLFVVACQTSPSLEEAVPPPPPPVLLSQVAPLPPPPPPVLTTLPELQSGGGQEALQRAISSGVTYPSVPAGQQQQGRVVVEFKVGTDGHVRDVRMVRSLAPAYDAAVLAAVRQLPALKPARRDGQPIELTLTVPLEFAAQPARWRVAD